MDAFGNFISGDFNSTVAGGSTVIMGTPHWVARAQFQGFSPADESLRLPFLHAYGAVRMWRRTSAGPAGWRADSSCSPRQRAQRVELLRKLRRPVAAADLECRNADWVLADDEDVVFRGVCDVVDMWVSQSGGSGKDGQYPATAWLNFWLGDLLQVDLAPVHPLAEGGNVCLEAFSVKWLEEQRVGSPATWLGSWREQIGTDADYHFVDSGEPAADDYELTARVLRVASSLANVSVQASHQSLV